MPIAVCANCPAQYGTGANLAKIFELYIDTNESISQARCWVAFFDEIEIDDNSIESATIGVDTGTKLFKKLQRIAQDPVLMEKLRAHLLEGIGPCSGRRARSCPPLDETALLKAINKTV